MLKRFLTAAGFTMGFVLSVGAGTMLADCYQECDMVITDDTIIMSCGPVWCDDGEGG